MRLETKSTLNEIYPTVKEFLFTLLFTAGETNEHWCFLSYGFISGSVDMIFYQPKLNFISLKMTAMKWHPQWVSYRLLSCKHL